MSVCPADGCVMLTVMACHDLGVSCHVEGLVTQELYLLEVAKGKKKKKKTEFAQQNKSQNIPNF